ncbi:MAG TPA: hypothetical protein VNH22_10650 [Blastocatellia bacterium]|jgi:hypothetical protein|nr:hypothetical protein [Blastocatellia bacterium]
MKRSALLASLLFSSIFICLITTPEAFGQKGCRLNIVGTWKAASPDGASPVLYRFSSDSTVTVLSSLGPEQSAEMREIATATYKLDDPGAPKAITFKAAREGGGFAQGTTSMGIAGYDDVSITCVRPGVGPVRWVRVDPYRYFVALVGRSGTFYDRSGPAFPMLLKIDEGKTQVDAVGIYAIRNAPIFGTVPPETYNEFMKEPGNGSDVMLRLEITGTQYERGLKILRTWERRVMESELLYPDIFMDNILLVKQLTESLNQCGERIKLYNLDWGVDDKVSDNRRPSHIPFLYFKELRRLNESLHIRDEKFGEYGHQMQKSAGQ